MLSVMSAPAFADRARPELQATGETVRKRTVETVSELTAQEAYIARLAVDGRTNPEIGAQLYLGARTVEWHLRKVYTKLGVGSRRELRWALASLGQADPRAWRSAIKTVRGKSTGAARHRQPPERADHPTLYPPQVAAPHTSQRAERRVGARLSLGRNVVGSIAAPGYSLSDCISMHRRYV
jgi:DNA-binding CsgD family transcriptional regulator